MLADGEPDLVTVLVPVLQPVHLGLLLATNVVAYDLGVPYGLAAWLEGVDDALGDLGDGHLSRNLSGGVATT